VQYSILNVIIINNDNIYIELIKTKGVKYMNLHYGLDDLKEIDIMSFLPIILPVVVIGIILILIALIDLYRNRKTRKNVLMWTLIIIFVNTLGPILYFVIGRKDSETI